MEPMLPADWLEYVAQKEHDIQRPPATPKRRMPKITRMESPRMRAVSTQTRNPIRAIYGMENDRNITPVQPDDWDGTHEVGPGDEFNPESAYRTGKPTQGQPNYGRRPTRARGVSRGPRQKVDYDKLADEFDI